MSDDKKLPEFWSFNRTRDSHLIAMESLIWEGPYSWFGFQSVNQYQETPDVAGVYLFCFDYQDGYILSGAGHTNSMKRRFSVISHRNKRGLLRIAQAETLEHQASLICAQFPNSFELSAIVN